MDAYTIVLTPDETQAAVMYLRILAETYWNEAEKSKVKERRDDLTAKYHEVATLANTIDKQRGGHR